MIANSSDGQVAWQESGYLYGDTYETLKNAWHAFMNSGGMDHLPSHVLNAGWSRFMDVLHDTSGDSRLALSQCYARMGELALYG